MTRLTDLPAELLDSIFAYLYIFDQTRLKLLSHPFYAYIPGLKTSQLEKTVQANCALNMCRPCLRIAAARCLARIVSDLHPFIYNNRLRHEFTYVPFAERKCPECGRPVVDPFRVVCGHEGVKVLVWGRKDEALVWACEKCAGCVDGELGLEGGGRVVVLDSIDGCCIYAWVI